MIALAMAETTSAVIPGGDVGPFAGLIAFLGGLGYLVREWRMGRQADVRTAEARAEKAEEERETDINRLKGEIEGLRSEIAGLREDIASQRRHYEVQMEQVHREGEQKTRQIFLLREWILSGRAVTGELPPDAK